jgi:hypothetical protein
VARGQPNLHPARHRNHRRRPTLASVVTAAANVVGSTAPMTRIRDPFTNSSSIMPGAGSKLAYASGYAN